MNDTSAIDLAYLAGIIDADGYVTASMVDRGGGTYFGAQIGITGSSPEPHHLAARIFGGNVNCHKPGGARAHHLMQFHWQLNGRRAVPAIEAVLPFLRFKADRASLVLQLQEEVDWIRIARQLGEDPAPWAPAGWDPGSSLRALVEDIRSLSTRSIRVADARVRTEIVLDEVTS